MSVVYKKDENITFHPELLTISLFNLRKIKQSYSDVLGLNHIDHLSINIVNPKNEITFLSSTPLTGINVCSGDLWKYDDSIAPKKFKHKLFYWWDECYAKSHFLLLKKLKEYDNDLASGFVCVDKQDDFYLLYSFASKASDQYFKENVENLKYNFIKMGRHCYNNVKNIYANYSEQHTPPDIK